MLQRRAAGQTPAVTLQKKETGVNLCQKHLLHKCLAYSFNALQGQNYSNVPKRCALKVPGAHIYSHML